MSTAIAGGSATAVEQSPPNPIRFALLGHPNTGRTTLFNRLCGLRARTANYPGTTLVDPDRRLRGRQSTLQPG